MRKSSMIWIVVLMCVSLLLVSCGEKTSNSTEKQQKEPLPFFEEHGLEANAFVNKGQFELENGIMYRHQDGTNYQRKTAYWEVKSGTETDLGDGRKEVTFTAYCYFPIEDKPTTNQLLSWGCESSLYDYYMGTWLTAKDTTGNTAKEANTYSFKLDINGEETEISYSFSTVWNPNVPGYNRVLEKEYVVQCPKDYDGLVLCAHQRGETFEQDEVNKDEAERIEELITITERENKDATKTLRFRIK